MSSVNQSSLVSGFLPTLWTEGMLKYAEKQFMLKNLVTDFSSLAVEGGKIINVPQLLEATSTGMTTNGDAVTFQADDDAVSAITCNQHPYEARRVEDIAQAQAS